MEQKSTKTIVKVSLGVLIVVLLGLSALLVTILVFDNSDKKETELSFTTEQIAPQPSTALQANEVETKTKIQTMEVTTKQPAIDLVIDNQEENEEDEGLDEENEIQVSSSNAKITELQAKQIAEQETGGKVTDVDTDRIKGKDAWEIEIRRNGKEADVLIDMQTGAVLAVVWETDEEEDDD